MHRFTTLALLFLLLIGGTAVMAQDATQTPIPTAEPGATVEPQEIIVLPASYSLGGIEFEYQGWNNCGPATITNALSIFGYTEGQTRAANWLKPNREDKNVSPDQMVAYVNSQVPELPVYSLMRVGGTLERLKQLISNDFPVIIEAGYDPEPDRLGWMGHYLLVSGYDDATAEFITQDSYLGPNHRYSYEHIQRFWQHFNYTYIVVYESGREPELLDLLGEDADVTQNALNALELATAEATADRNNAFAWFNMGTNFVALDVMDRAAVAYDEARRVGLPWRMLWYQFGPLEAYYEVGRYDDVIALTTASQNDGGGHYVEETFYYKGLGRLGQGDTARAIENFQQAINFNPNFTPAQDQLARLSQ
jgi:hypothetical protein